MKNCDVCGTFNLNENNYCTHCGCRIVNENICPFCGVKNPDSSNVCINCHKQITPIAIDSFDVLFSDYNRSLLLNPNFSVEDYSEHSLSQGSHAKAAAYIKMKNVITNQVTYGVGVSSNITRAGIRGIFSAMNRLFS